MRWHSRRGGKVVRWQFGKGERGGGEGVGVVRWQGKKDERVVRW